MGDFLAYLGHINIDINLRVDVIPQEGSTDVQKDTQINGGTLGNFCYVASRLGLPFDPYAAVAQSTQEKFLQDLSNRGLNLEHVQVFPEGRGPICYIANDGTTQAAFMSQGPMDEWKVSDTFDLAHNYEYVHFSTGPPEEYLKLARKCVSSKIVFDPSQEIRRYSDDMLSEFFSLSSMILCNEFESRRVFSMLGRDHGKTVIITRGSNEVELHHSGQRYIFSTIKRENVYDTIGAGDAFRAGLYAGLYRRMSIQEAVKMAIATASLAVLRPIPQFSSDWKEVSGMMADVPMRVD